MTLPDFTLRLRPRGFEPTEADIALKHAQQSKAVKNFWIIIAAVVGFLAVVRLLRYAVRLLVSSRPSEVQAGANDEKAQKVSPEAVIPGRTGKASWRRIPAALTSGFRVIAFRVSVPLGVGSASIAELFFIWSYMATILAFTFVNTNDLEAWFFQDRAAVLASCQVPFIVALAGKNNIISMITGIGHEKLNILHRASARTCLILLWIHALGHITSGLTSRDSLELTWMRCGVTGLVAFTLATILSIRFIRNAFFEFFLLAHIALVGVFIICGYLHTREVGFGDYLWPALVVWAFDRVLRTARVVWNNRARGGTAHDYGAAMVELVSSDTIRLTLRRKMNWRPGQHAYVIFPTVSDIPTEAHPFTIASIPHALDGSDGASGREKDVVFIVRGRSGFTKRLREYASRNGVSRVPAFVDGPYGCPPVLTEYSTCILIAGGSGVSYTLPLLLDLVRNARMGNINVRRVIFVWAVRESDHLAWISKPLYEALSAAQTTSLSVEIAVYVTGPNCTIPEIPRSASLVASSDGASTPTSSTRPPSDIGEVGKLDKELPVYSALQIIHGRPSIRRILQEGVESSTGSVSVDVSGPSSLTQGVSRALASTLTNPMNVLKGTPSVTLHIETFGMSK